VSIQRKDSFEVIKIASDDEPEARHTIMSASMFQAVSSYGPGDTRGLQDGPQPKCQFCGSRTIFVLKLTRRLTFTLPNGKSVPRPQVEEFTFCRECAMQAGLKLLDAHDGK
jgi:hypothetical protein